MSPSADKGVRAGATGGDAMVGRMRAHGAELAFGVPGGQLLALYEAMRRDGFRHVLVRHEQAAGFAAIGYARATGRPGIAIGTTGPGITNLVTPVAEAFTGAVPMVAISGQVDTDQIGAYRGHLHELPAQADVFASISRATALPRASSELLPSVDRAWSIARGPLPGPVYLEAPRDLLAGPSPAGEPAPIGVQGRPTLDGASIATAAEWIDRARHPVILAGGGVTGPEASSALLRLAHRIGAPVLTTVRGNGVVGVDGIWAGTLNPFARGDATQRLLEGADLLVAVGTRLDTVTTGGWSLRMPRLIRLDADPRASERHPADLAVTADAGVALEALARLVSARDGAGPGAMDTARATRRSSLGTVRGRPELRLLEGLRRVTPEDAFVAVDSMMFNMWTGFLWECPVPGRSLFSTSFDPLGSAIPTAVGAAFGSPSSPSLAICGDGGFGIGGMELATIAQHSLDVKILLINDGRLGSVALQQEARFDATFGVDLRNPDFVALARAFGIPARRARTVRGALSHLAAAFEDRGPFLLELQMEVGDPWP